MLVRLLYDQPVLNSLLIIVNFFSDELPVQLMLPKAIQEAKNRQQLSSLALLGQGKFSYLQILL